MRVRARGAAHARRARLPLQGVRAHGGLHEPRARRQPARRAAARTRGPSAPAASPRRARCLQERRRLHRRQSAGRAAARRLLRTQGVRGRATGARGA